MATNSYKNDMKSMIWPIPSLLWAINTAEKSLPGKIVNVV